MRHSTYAETQCSFAEKPRPGAEMPRILMKMYDPKRRSTVSCALGHYSLSAHNTSCLSREFLVVHMLEPGLKTHQIRMLSAQLRNIGLVAYSVEIFDGSRDLRVLLPERLDWNLNVRDCTPGCTAHRLGDLNWR